VANACLKRDPENEEKWLKVIYNTEEAYYRQRLNPYNDWVLQRRRLTELLADIRAKVKADFDSVMEYQLDSHNVFSDANIKTCCMFATDAFASSSECTNRLINFAKDICRHAEALIGSPPCRYDVVGLGSMARGEATPYSDLEFGYIVEVSEFSDYFVKLAMATYFTLNNLGETPLKGFYLEEMIDNSAQKCGWQWFNDTTTNGFRFDGITISSGNIPTGNGLPGSRALTFTVQELMDLYRKSLESEDGSQTVGNISYFFASTICLYSSDGRKSLHQEFCDERSVYEKVVASRQFQVRRNRLAILEADLIQFDFVPDFKADNGTDSKTAEVKTSIFRWPTLLGQNLNINLLLLASSPWDVFAALRNQGILTEEKEQQFRFILAAAIVIRNLAYLTHGTRRELLSFLTAGSSQEDDRYYVPQPLYITMGCMLQPIKRSVLKSLQHLKRLKIGNLLAGIRYVARNIEIDKNDFTAKAGLYYFAGDLQGGLRHIFTALGEKNAKSYSKVVVKIRVKYGTTQTDAFEKHSVTLIAFLLFTQQLYQPALHFFSELVFYARGHSERWRYQSIIAKCLQNLGKYPEALSKLERILTDLRGRYGAGTDTNLSSHLRSLCHHSAEMTDKVKALSVFAAALYQDIGNVCCGLSKYREANAAYNENLVLLDFAQTLGEDTNLERAYLYTAMARSYTYSRDLPMAADSARESLTLYQRIHGQNANHRSIQLCYHTLGTISYETGDYKDALEWYRKAREMSASLHSGGESDLDLALVYRMTGQVYANMGDTLTAIDNYQRAIEIQDAYSLNCDPARRASAYTLLAEQQLQSAQLEECDKSLCHALELSSIASNIPRNSLWKGEISRLQAELCLARGHTEAALRHLNTALHLCAGISFDSARTYLTLSKMHRMNGNLLKAITEAQTALAIISSESDPDSSEQLLVSECSAARQKYRLEFLAANPLSPERVVSIFNKLFTV